MNIKEKIKSFDDVLLYHGISQQEFEKKVEGLTSDEKAYIQLKYIAAALNEGWIPDWSNGEWDKYYPWFYMNDEGSSGRFSFHGSDDLNSDSTVGSRLCFKSRKLAIFAGEHFEDLYRDYFVID